MSWDAVDILEAMELDPFELDRLLDAQREMQKWLRANPERRIRATGEGYDQHYFFLVEQASNGRLVAESPQTTQERERIKQQMVDDTPKIQQARLHVTAALILSGAAPRPDWHAVNERLLRKTILAWSRTLGLQFKTRGAVRRYIAKHRKIWPKKPYVISDVKISIGGIPIEDYLKENEYSWYL